MTMSTAKEERCRELLAKLKDAIDKRGVLLDKLGKVMEETVSSLTVSTPLLVRGTADSTPNSTATNKVPAMTNAALSANTTLTDQAHTRCSRSGLDTNTGDLHVVAASNPETGVPTVAPAPAEHSSAPSSKPFSSTQQDTMTPTKCLTSGLDSNTGIIHVPATSLLTMAASMAVRAPKGSSSLLVVVVPAPTRVACGMIMKFGLCKFNEKAINKVVLNGVPLLILGLGKIEEFLGTVVRLQPWPPPASPNCIDLLVKVDKVLGHVVDITLRWAVLQPPWLPPNLTAQINMSYDDQVSDGSSITPKFALSGWSYAIEPIGITKENALTKPGLMEQIKREISIMRLVKHPNVLQLFEIIASKSKIYFVLEYAKGGELFNKIAKGGRLSEDAARRYFHRLISAVDYCHSRGVYHRDLKPENLLLDEKENLEVSDFGLSALAESKRQQGLLPTTCGTPAYVAPEVLSRKGYDGAKADIWSYGVRLWLVKKFVAERIHRKEPGKDLQSLDADITNLCEGTTSSFNDMHLKSKQSFHQNVLTDDGTKEKEEGHTKDDNMTNCVQANRRLCQGFSLDSEDFKSIQNFIESQMDGTSSSLSSGSPSQGDLLQETSNKFKIINRLESLKKMDELTDQLNRLSSQKDLEKRYQKKDLQYQPLLNSYDVEQHLQSVDADSISSSCTLEFYYGHGKQPMYSLPNTFSPIHPCTHCHFGHLQRHMPYNYDAWEFNSYYQSSYAGSTILDHESLKSSYKEQKRVVRKSISRPLSELEVQVSALKQQLKEAEIHYKHKEEQVLLERIVNASQDEVMKWVEFSSSFVGKDAEQHVLLGSLNHDLSQRSVLLASGFKPSVVDIVVFATVQVFVSHLSDSELKKYPHILRWMDYIQNIIEEEYTDVQSLFAGYSSFRLYKMFKGSEWKKNTLKTACMVPGIVFTIFFILNAIIWAIEIPSDANLADTVEILSKNKILSAPIRNADAPEDASWIDKYIGIVEFAGMAMWLLNQSEAAANVTADYAVGSPVANLAARLGSFTFRRASSSRVETTTDSESDETASVGGNIFETLTSSEFYKNTKVGDISGSFQWAPFLALQTSDTFLTMLLLLSKYRMKSLPVVDMGMRSLLVLDTVGSYLGYKIPRQIPGCFHDEAELDTVQ